MTYRADDPETSVEAAQSIDVAGLEAKVVEYLRLAAAFGGTSEEIADGLRLPRVTVSPRLAPLERKGLVVRTALRRQGTSRRSQIVWAHP